MSYEQVRDWFSETTRRAQEGKELFSEEEGEEEAEGEEGDDEEEGVAVEQVDSEGEMEVKEQREEATDDDCNEEEEAGKEEIQEECEAFSQSQTAEQTWAERWALCHTHTHWHVELESGDTSWSSLCLFLCQRFSAAVSGTKLRPRCPSWEALRRWTRPGRVMEPTWSFDGTRASVLVFFPLKRF